MDYQQRRHSLSTNLAQQPSGSTFGPTIIPMPTTPASISASPIKAPSELLPKSLKFSRTRPHIRKRSQTETQQPQQVQQAQQAPLPPSLADNELILTINPTEERQSALVSDIKRILLSWRLPNLLDNWGSLVETEMPNVAIKSVVFNSRVQPAAVLRWNSNWGSKPTTTDSICSYEQIESSIAVQAISQLDGWDNLDSRHQEILRNLIGGETNYLSQHTRRVIQDNIDLLSNDYNTDDRAKFLRGLITNGQDSYINDVNAIPHWVSESSVSERAQYTFGFHKRIENFDFRTGRAHGEQQLISWQGVNKKTVTIYSPEEVDRDRRRLEVQKIANDMSSMTKESRSPNRAGSLAVLRRGGIAG